MRESERVCKTSLTAMLMISLVMGYRLLVSPLLPKVCRFKPSCSHYSMEALKTHGALKGIVLSAGRIFRCRPFGGCGYDPVPEARKERME